MRIHIYYSSLTGNTKKLAQYLYQQLIKEGKKVSLQETKDVKEPLQGEIQILAFWCRRSCMDDISLRLLHAMQGEKIIAVGTLGGKAGEAYGRRVEKAVHTVIEEQNHCLGVYACQGMINPVRTEKRRALPQDSPHYLDDENYARHLANHGRPHEEDLKNTLEFVRDIIERQEEKR